VTGSVTAGSITNAHGVNNLAAGNITVIGNVTASSAANGINSTNTSSVVRASGSFTYGANGTMPIMASRFFLNSTPLNSRTRYALNGTSTYFDMYGADNNAAGGVATSDVRAGVTYAGLTGTCAVPPAASVSLGVPVDNTTGTAVLTGSDMATAVWGAATRTITGGLVDTATTLTNSPDVPTEAEIASAVWGAATKEITGGTVTNLTNAPASVTPSDIWSHSSRTLTSASGPTAVQIRQEIDANSTKLDAAISTRLAGSAYTAPANSDISAIKAKTDLLETTRLAQCSTVATTGAQLAAALS
jgi:hypothetical protein